MAMSGPPIRHRVPARSWIGDVRMADHQHLVVVGNGMVGQRVVDAMQERDLDRSWRVTVLGEEPRRAYDRVALSSYFDGVTADELDVVPDGCYTEGGYTLHLDEQVLEIDTTQRRVITSRGRNIDY